MRLHKKEIELSKSENSFLTENFVNKQNSLGKLRLSKNVICTLKNLVTVVDIV